MALPLASPARMCEWELSVPSLQSRPEKTDAKGRRHAARTILSVNLLVLVILTTAVALCRPCSRHHSHWSQSLLSRIETQHQVCPESLLLATLAWLAGVVIAGRAPRTGVVTGVLLIATVSIPSVLEIVSWLTLRAYFLSATTLALVTAVIQISWSRNRLTVRLTSFGASRL